MLHGIKVLNIGNIVLECGGYALARTTRHLSNLTVPCSYDIIIRKGKENGQFLQFVRNRKPAWAHIAGTKLHNVLTHKEQPLEEAQEIKRRYMIYKTVMKSLRAEFWSEVEAERAAELEKEEDIVDVIRMENVRKITEEFNKKSAEMRKSFEVEELVAKEKENEELVKEVEALKIARKEEALKLLERIQQERSSFIDCSRLDEVIEESLNQRATFNFFINKYGVRFVENLDGTITEIDENGNPVKNETTPVGETKEPLEFVSGEVVNKSETESTKSVHDLEAKLDSQKEQK